MILPITLSITGAAALVNVWLAIRCGRVRAAEKVSIGDGGNERLMARMRAHSNFVEYTPFVLILIALIEMASGTATWLWVLGIAYILARVAHGVGMDGVMPLRAAGTIVTMLTLAGLGLYAIALPFLSAGTVTSEVEVGAVQKLAWPALRATLQ